MPVPPQTAQARFPVPVHSLHSMTKNPTNRFPVPPHLPQGTLFSPRQPEHSRIRIFPSLQHVHYIRLFPNPIALPPSPASHVAPRSLDVSCWNCHHRPIMSADLWPDHVPVPTFGPRMVCTRCGIIGVDARPNLNLLQCSTPLPRWAIGGQPHRKQSSGNFTPIVMD